VVREQCEVDMSDCVKRFDGLGRMRWDMRLYELEVCCGCIVLEGLSWVRCLRWSGKGEEASSSRNSPVETPDEGGVMV